MSNLLKLPRHHNHKLIRVTYMMSMIILEMNLDSKIQMIHLMQEKERNNNQEQRKYLILSILNMMTLNTMKLIIIASSKSNHLLI